jgi:hypothetical protein
VAALFGTSSPVEQRCRLIHCFNVQNKERDKEMNRMKGKKERR